MNNNFYYTNFRWLVITTLLYFGASFGQTFFIAIFAGYIRYDFDISHTTWGSIYALGTCLSAALMFKLGGITEKFKSVMLSIVVIISLAFFCFLMIFCMHQNILKHKMLGTENLLSLVGDQMEVCLLAQRLSKIQITLAPLSRLLVF